MHDELVKQLREADEKSMCGECGLNLHTGATKKGVLFAEAAEAIEELTKPRWIPVTERLPEDRRDVLVYAGVMFPYITVGYYDGLWKFSFNDEEIAGSADYWMPLPTPPKEEQT